MVFGKQVIPSSSRNPLVTWAASRIISKLTPGDGSRSMRSSSAWSMSSQCVGQTWKPRQPRLTAQTTWAMSASTRALDVVPLGVVTIVVCSQGGAPAGTRFWKNDLPAAPSGKRCIRAGRPRATSMKGCSTAW